jgi:hypothetical protein
MLAAVSCSLGGPDLCTRGGWVSQHHKRRLLTCVTCCAEHLRRQIEALLSRHEVDLVLSGHVHSYARTCNVLAGSCVDMRDGG